MKGLVAIAILLVIVSISSASNMNYRTSELHANEATAMRKEFYSNVMQTKSEIVANNELRGKTFKFQSKTFQVSLTPKLFKYIREYDISKEQVTSVQSKTYIRQLSGHKLAKSPEDIGCFVGANNDTVTISPNNACAYFISEHDSSLVDAAFSKIDGTSTLEIPNEGFVIITDESQGLYYEFKKAVRVETESSCYINGNESTASISLRNSESVTITPTGTKPVFVSLGNDLVQVPKEGVTLDIPRNLSKIKQRTEITVVFEEVPIVNSNCVDIMSVDLTVQNAPKRYGTILENIEISQ